MKLNQAFRGRWHIARWLRLGMGVMAIAYAISFFTWPTAVIGAVLIAQAAFDVGCGCAGASSCELPAQSSTDKKQA